MMLCEPISAFALRECPHLNFTSLFSVSRLAVSRSCISRRALCAAAGMLAAFAAGMSSTANAQAPHTLSPTEQARVNDIVRQMTLEEKLAYIGGTGFAVRAMPRLHLPSLEMSDGPYGVRSNAGLPSGTYAAGIGLAATWDRALAAKVGESIGRDGRARGIDYQLGPGTNIYRSPRNGRNFEYFGEDPYLAG